MSISIALKWDNRVIDFMFFFLFTVTHMHIDLTCTNIAMPELLGYAINIHAIHS